MKKIKLKIMVSILAMIIALVSIPAISKAAGTFSATISKTEVTVGDTFTVNVTATTASGLYEVKASNSNVSTTSSGSGFLDNSSETWTFKAEKAGTATITAKATDMTDNDDDTKTVSGSKTFTVTVKAKPTTNTGSQTGSNTGSNSGSTTTPKEPKFTSVDETVYSTTELNVRKSYSTSSSIIGSLDEGESVKRIGIGDNGWSKIKYNGQTAYVSSSYLTKTKPVVEKPKEEKNDQNTIQKEEKNEVVSKEEKNAPKNSETNKNEENKENVNTAQDEKKLKLINLDITGVNFAKGFNSEIYSYELQLNFFVKKLNITAEANQADAKIEIIGNEDFKEGENDITILVKSADEKQIVTYQIKVIVPSEVQNNPQNSIQFYITVGSVTLIAIVAITIVISIYKAKNARYEKNEVNLKIDEQYEEDTPKRNRGRHSN